MRYPTFFDAVPRLRLRDPLALFLGAVEDGIIEYAYLDAVKLAGHSCPTVASAYWMTCLALKALYAEEPAERGALRVEFRDDRQSGVTGVIANVAAMLTGAAGDTGFKGLAGRFDRRNLLVFNAAVPLEIRFTRVDNGAQVDVAANLRQIPADPEMSGLMQRSLGGTASAAEEKRFGALWQDRVRRILLDHGEDPEVFLVRRVVA
ncbi:MAG: hypothetical protein HY847_17050 [Betaproteobacteria bacterium]|nr:hypothetical protein [Betaproteobacteria bacterium]